MSHVLGRLEAAVWELGGQMTQKFTWSKTWYFDPRFLHLATILVLICLYCLNCTKFGQLFLRKIMKTVATRCHILRLKCTKFDSDWGSVPDPIGGAHSAPPGPKLDLRGPISKGREGSGEGERQREGNGKGRKGKEEEGEERNGKGFWHPSPKTVPAPLARRQLLL